MCVSKAPIFSRRAFNMFQARSVLESTYDLFQTLATFPFSPIVFNSAIEIGLHSLYRNKVIAAFDLNKIKIVGSPYSFPRKNDDLSLAREPYLIKMLELFQFPTSNCSNS